VKQTHPKNTQNLHVPKPCADTDNAQFRHVDLLHTFPALRHSYVPEDPAEVEFLRNSELGLHTAKHTCT
jgi:hypothetical protein